MFATGRKGEAWSEFEKHAVSLAVRELVVRNREAQRKM